MNGCFDDSLQTITLNASPNVVFAPIPSVCEANDTIQITQAKDIYGLLPNIGYYSGNGIIPGTNQFAVAGAGSHIITYSDTSSFGCISSGTQPLFVYAKPVINMDGLRTVLGGGSITLSPKISGNIQTYLWSPGTYLSSTSIANPVSKPVQDITYNLKVISKDGCEADSSVFVKVLMDFIVPNTFTPNNDGIHDFWAIKELPLYPIQSVRVFNRSGQMVYETKRYPAIGWDGNYKGKPLPFGTYYYIIELDGIIGPKVGYVTILK